jgi:uncharacterized protein (TIGR04222 family)
MTWNPLDLRGPEFLIFYVTIGVLLLWGLYRSCRAREPSNGAAATTLSDPRPIAFLRGGANDLLRLITVTLVDRGLLKVVESETRLGAAAPGFKLESVNPATVRSVADPLERQVLTRFATAEEPKVLFGDEALKESCAAYEERLTQAGLIPDARLKVERWLCSSWLSPSSGESVSPSS